MCCRPLVVQASGRPALHPTPAIKHHDICIPGKLLSQPAWRRVLDAPLGAACQVWGHLEHIDFCNIWLLDQFRGGLRGVKTGK
jgi:hypothetical protein